MADKTKHPKSTRSRAKPSPAKQAARGMARGLMRGITEGITSVMGVLVMVLILFLWLHFFVAQQNELTGRAIQERAAELERAERQNMALRQQLATLWSEPAMAQRARALNYMPQPPLYLLLNRPLVPAAGNSLTEPPLLSWLTRHAPLAGDENPGSQADLAAEASGQSVPVTVAERP